YDAEHVPLPISRDTKSLSLADREPLVTVVFSENIALGIDHRSRRGERRPPVANELRMIPVWDEADFNAVRFLCDHRQSGAVSDRPDFLLAEHAEWEQEARQDLAAKAGQDVGLVFFWIDSFVKFLFAARAGEDAGVVPGRDEIGLDPTAELPEFAKL